MPLGGLIKGRLSEDIFVREVWELLKKSAWTCKRGLGVIKEDFLGIFGGRRLKMF